MIRRLSILVLAALTLLPGCALFKALFGIHPEIAGEATSPPPGGTWIGEWTNKETGATGTARITAMGYPGMVYVSYEIAGDLLGCNQPSVQGTIMLNQGTDFTKKGIKLTQHDAALGDFTLTSKGKRTRGGATGACGGTGPEWDTRTRALKNVVSGKIFLTGKGADREKTTFKLRRCTGQECQS